MAYKKPEILNPKQKKFCENYVGRFFGEPIFAYADAYNIDLEKDNKQYITCSAASTRLLKDVRILQYIREIQPETAIADEIVDTELMFTIQQRGELGAKVAAINTYNKLKGRIIDKLQADNKLEVVYINQANANTTPGIT